MAASCVVCVTVGHSLWLDCRVRGVSSRGWQACVLLHGSAPFLGITAAPKQVRTLEDWLRRERYHYQDVGEKLK